MDGTVPKSVHFDVEQPTRREPVRQPSYERGRYQNRRDESVKQGRQERKMPIHQKQMNMHTRLNNPYLLNELENEPAFVRRKVQLDDVPHSSESVMSKWTLTDDEQPELNKNNSFLHDNVD